MTVFLTFEKLPIEDIHPIFRSGYEEVKYDATNQILSVGLHVRPIICLEDENTQFSDNMMKMYEPDVLPRNLRVIEMESYMIAGGCFIEQFPETHERVGHNKTLVRMKQAKDMIAFNFDT